MWAEDALGWRGIALGSPLPKCTAPLEKGTYCPMLGLLAPPEEDLDGHDPHLVRCVAMLKRECCRSPRLSPASMLIGSELRLSDQPNVCVVRGGEEGQIKEGSIYTVPLKGQSLPLTYLECEFPSGQSPWHIEGSELNGWLANELIKTR